MDIRAASTPKIAYIHCKTAEEWSSRFRVLSKYKHILAKIDEWDFSLHTFISNYSSGGYIRIRL